MSVQHPPSSLLKLARAGQKPSCLIKMFAALSATNEAILRINSREKLFQQVCEAAMQSGSFLAAVILTPEPGTDVLKVVAGAGEDAELRARSYSSLATSPLGNGLVGIACRTLKPCVALAQGGGRYRSDGRHGPGQAIALLDRCREPLRQGHSRQSIPNSESERQRGHSQLRTRAAVARIQPTGRNIRKLRRTARKDEAERGGDPVLCH